MNATLEGNQKASSREAGAEFTQQFHELFDSVEDLIKRVAEIDSPEIQKMRAKARVAMIMAKSALQDGATHVGRQARWAAGTTDDYLRQYPWYALGIGTMLGFGVGLLVARSGD
jgi:ElaB protein